ncbi:hypothetical protein HQ29_06145 [Porphyromonas canoris]|uniref:THUMP-like domain-containing protein n=1 Tax=Porphyromonas canoris TaxID=36875 RepID=UPI00051D056A|nr:hypothetical protein [Porphyromonas canoris]KGL52482.1 hypothetical protein HQ29_06145 [Porphyromonas canoris]
MEVPAKILNLIEQYKSENAYELSMRLKDFTPEERMQISTGVLSKQKIRHKLPLWYENRDVYIPDPTIAEQASSHITATEKCRWISSYDIIIDLTGGLGADTIAFSAKAKQLIYVEPSSERADAFRRNAEVLRQKVEVYNATAEDFIRNTFPSIDIEQKKILLYADPDRRPDGSGRREQDPRNCVPDIIETESHLRSHHPSADLLVKLSPIADISLLNRLFSSAPSVIHALALDGELKEVCLLFDRAASEDSFLTATHISHGISESTTKPNKRYPDLPILQDLDSFRYLYIPNPALSKIGLGGTPWADRLFKIAPSTHLYFSKEPMPFPGRVYEILCEHSWNKRTIASFSGKSYGLIAKNFDLKAEELRKKLKIREGDHSYLFAFRDSDSKRRLLEAQKIVIKEGSNKESR